MLSECHNFRVVVLALVALLGGCKANEPQSLKVVTLPDLSRLEESVQAQLGERYKALTAKQQNPKISAGDLGTEFGEMGKLLMAAGFRDPAEAALLNAESLAPADMRWSFYLGDLYKQKGDIPSAVAAFERALKASPDDVPTMIRLAEAALDEGRPDTAEPLLTKALSVQPGAAAAHYGLGRAALARKDYTRAVQHLEQALMLDSKASVIHYSLAMAYRGLGDRGQADRHLQQRGTLQVQPDALTKALDDVLHSALTYEKNADTAGRRGEWAAAAEYLRKAIALAPTRASPRHKLGTALFYMGDRSGAFNEFREAVRLSPSFAAAHYALGVLHEDAGNHQLAIESFSTAIKSEPTYIDARVGLADALRRSGRHEQSLQEYEQTLKLDPAAVRARFGAAAALVRLNRYQEAGDRFTAAMNLYPNELSFARAAARLFAAAPDDRVRDGRRALEIGQALLSRQPQTIELTETMAMASAEIGEYDAALKWQRQALEAAERVDRRDMMERLSGNLERYQARRPCRTPWQTNEPIEF